MPSNLFVSTINWTPERDAELASLYAEGWTWDEVGQIMGLHRSTAYSRGRKLGIQMRQHGQLPMAYGNASYDLVHRNVDGKPNTFAHFVCRDCGEVLDIPLIGSMGPGGYIKEAAKRGWSAHWLKRSKVFCQTCVNKRPENDPDSELKKVNGAKMNGTTNVTPLAGAPREITSEERVKIRGALDSHFDDGIGCYHDDWSDDKIATALNVPRVAVERLREAAYGPIKVDPVMAGLRAEMAQAKRDLDAVKAMTTKLESTLMGLGSRIEKRVTGKT